MNLSGKDGGVKKGENLERVAFLVRYTKIRDAMDKKNPESSRSFRVELYCIIRL